MAHLFLDGDDLVVRLGALEKLGAFRGNVRVPRSTITACRVSPNPWEELRGLRAPGTGIPRVISLCTRRGNGIKDFAAVYGTKPAVVIDLEGADFDRLVVTVSDPEAVAARINGG